MTTTKRRAAERESWEEYRLRVDAAPPSTWDMVDVEALISAGLEDEPAPNVLFRNDGPALLYRGKVNSMHGTAEACKGWLTLEACRQEIAGEHAVLYIDFEDSPTSILRRLRLLGVSDDAMIEYFSYVHPEQSLTDKTRLNLERSLWNSEADFVVIDGITQAISNQGGSSNDNDSVAQFFNALPRKCSETGAAVLMIDHIPKDSSNTRFAIGGMTKLAAVDGATYYADLTEPFGVGMSGVMQLTVTKDRPGLVRPYGGKPDSNNSQPIATVQLESDAATGLVTVTVGAPEGARDLVPERMLQIYAYVKEQSELDSLHCSKTNLFSAVKGNREVFDKAFDKLVAGGWLVFEKRKPIRLGERPMTTADMAAITSGETS